MEVVKCSRCKKEIKKGETKICMKCLEKLLEMNKKRRPPLAP